MKMLLPNLIQCKDAPKVQKSSEMVPPIKKKKKRQHLHYVCGYEDMKMIYFLPQQPPTLKKSFFFSQKPQIFIHTTADV